MTNFRTWEDYQTDQNPDCLKNKLNLTNPETLDTFEGELSFLRTIELSRKPLQKNFDLAHLQETHFYLFQDVYEWAGQIRTFDMIKGNTYFISHSIIDRGSRSLFKQLAEQRYLQGLNMADFSDCAGHFLGEINYLHPFREGNGRTQRAFINQLAAKNNYFITWKKTSQSEMIEASIQAHDGNHHLLTKIIRDNLMDQN